MDWPALAAAIGGPLVGIAALWRSSVDARENRAQALALARAQHEHEREVDRASRHFEMRRDTYTELLRTALMALEAINLTEPIGRVDGDERRQVSVPTEDEWNILVARVLATGSAAARDAAETYWMLSRVFFIAAGVYQQVRDAAGPGHQTAAAHDEMQQARDAATAAFENLKNLVRDELENL